MFLRSNLCDFSDANIVVKGIIVVYLKKNITWRILHEEVCWIIIQIKWTMLLIELLLIAVWAITRQQQVNLLSMKQQE